MSTPYLIIDGYNLMHAAGIGRRSYGPGDLQRCRIRLCQLVSNGLASEVLHRALLVFDAFDSPSDDEREQFISGVRVLFAPRGSDADSEIERLLKEHDSPKQVIVVSGDRRLQIAARKRRSKCVDSERFLNVIQEENDNGFHTTSTAGVDTKEPAQEHLTKDAAVPGKGDVSEDGMVDAAFDLEYLNQLKLELDEGRPGAN